MAARKQKRVSGGHLILNNLKKINQTEISYQFAPEGICNPATLLAVSRAPLGPGRATRVGGARAPGGGARAPRAATALEN